MEARAQTLRIDLGGQYFDIDQDFIDKYPESVFAKSLELTTENNGERIPIDRCSKNFSKILEYSLDEEAIRFSQMSHIEIRKLLSDAEFYCIEEIAQKCRQELENTIQSSISTVPNPNI